MRSDMAKVIVERPRHGSRQKSRKGYRKLWQRLAPEDWPKSEGIFAHKGKTKFFNEHLGPLRRYLQKQIGRPWNKVFSEICENLRVDSAVQSHVRDHLNDYVETCVIEIDGIPCNGTYPVGRPITRGYKLFYVCPRTGLLRANKHQRQQMARTPIERISVDESCEYRLMKGIWYEVMLSPITVAAWGERDMVLSTEVGPLSPATAIRIYGRSVFAVKRRQLNKREIRRLRLNERF
jgi:hypothetical protein